VLNAYRTMSSFPKAIYNGLLQQEKVTMTHKVDSILNELGQLLLKTSSDRTAHEAELSPNLAHPARQGTLAALMKREENRAAEAIGSISGAACSCQKAAIQEAVNTQQLLHNAAHIMGQLLNSWVMPQDLEAQVSTENNEETSSMEVQSPRLASS
jgi:hypothetical protein